MTICALLCMPSKNIFKYFKCWAEWSIKGESEVTPPTSNSSQSNFSLSEKSESRGKMLETSEMITHYGTRTIWRVLEVADVHSWINRCLKSVPTWGRSSARVGHRDTNVERWVHLSRDRDVLRRPWRREHWACTVCSVQSKGTFLTLLLKTMPMLQPKLFPQLPCIYSSENQPSGFTVFEYFHKKLLHFTMSQQCSEWKPSVNISMGHTTRSLIAVDIPHQWDPRQPWVSRLWITTQENHTTAATNIWYFKYFTSTVMLIILGWLVVN